MAEDLDLSTQRSTGFRTEGMRLAPGLTVLSHPDVKRVGDVCILSDLISTGGRVGVSRTEPAFLELSERTFSPLNHPYLSRKPLWLQRLPDGGVSVDASATSTEVLLDGDAVTKVVAVSATALAAGVVVSLGSRLTLLLHIAQLPDAREVPDLGLVGESATLRRLRDDILRVADTAVSVLLRGETGTGKELAARAIHEQSSRADKPFLSINMSTLPPTLAASLLFGHDKGAFSGAGRARTGYFTRADSGTLFLDEIGDTPHEVQAMLLRALETGLVTPVGAERDQAVDVRVIAATDANLEAAIDDERFRAPLLHRLSGFVIPLPALRERRDDIGRLLHHFLREELARVNDGERLTTPDDRGKPWLPAGLVARLARYDWPGNVRELRNAARQIVIASRGLPRAQLGPYLERLILPSARPGISTAPRGQAPSIVETPPPAARKPAQVTEDELIEALRANEWRVAPTAAQLGLARPSVYHMIERSDRIRKAKDLAPDEIIASQAAHESDLDAMACALEVSKRGLLLRMRELDLG